MAFAPCLDRTGILGERRILEIDGSCGRERGSVARQAGRQHAVEHIHAPCDHFDYLRRCAESHGVARMIRRQVGDGILNGAEHLVLRLADTHAADGIAIEADFHKGSCAFFS